MPFSLTSQLNLHALAACHCRSQDYPTNLLSLAFIWILIRIYYVKSSYQPFVTDLQQIIWEQ